MTISFMVLTIIVGFVIYKNNVPQTVVCATPDPVLFCGTESNFTETALNGRKIFNTHCAACHSMRRKMAGPAFAEMDSIKIREWLTQMEEKIDSTKYSEMGIDFHKNMWGDVLNEEEIGQLIEYSWTK